MINQSNDNLSIESVNEIKIPVGRIRAERLFKIYGILHGEKVSWWQYGKPGLEWKSLIGGSIHK